MINLFLHFKGYLQGRYPLLAARSGKWPTVRKNHLKVQPNCAVCGGVNKLNVHHIRPFHVHPELELDPSNLITLCESEKNGVNCHLWFGHLGNFHSFNVNVATDAEQWNNKFVNRPKGNVDEKD